MAFGTLEDLEGSFDLVIFSEPFLSFGSLLKRAATPDPEQGPLALLVTGTLEAGESPKVLVNHVLELANAEEQLSTQLTLTLLADEATQDRLLAVKSILASHPGACAVALRVVIPGTSETLVALPNSPVRLDSSLREGLNGLFGRNVTELTV